MNKNICLVTHDFEGIIPVGGIGTYYNELARLLSKNGWNVVVLFHHYEGRNISKFSERYFEEYGIPIYDATELCAEGNESTTEIWRDSTWYQARSHISHEALQVLIKKYGYKFDLIEFSEWGAGAFIPIRMDKNFKIYENSNIIVKLHSPSQWHREGCMQEFTTPDDLKLDYMERYSFENADIQVSPTQHLLEWCKEHGWNVRKDADICTNPIENLKYDIKKIGLNTQRDTAKLDEIVFFGRFEERKGLSDFINAIKYINSVNLTFLKQYKITFIGKEGEISKDYIKISLKEFDINILTLSSRKDVIKYLKENAGVVILPSRMDNFPNTVIECMCAKIPFITSRSGGIPEILGINSELYDAISCDTTYPKNLGNWILKYLDYNGDYMKRLLELAYQRVEEIVDPKKLVSWYNNMLYKKKSYVEPKKDEKYAKEQPKVTIVIPYYNMHKYIENTLKSLLNQTYKNFKMILINDGSTDPKSTLMLDYIKNKYPSVIILNKENGGIGSALNYVLPNIDTKYIVLVDADNIAKPHMLKTFVECIENRKDVVALSQYFAVFQDKDEKTVMKSILSSKKFKPRFYYKPVGPCLPLLFFENTQGDANSIFLTKAVKSVGGWSENRLGFHDWAMWIKLIANGYKVDVIPQVLFYYRDHPTSDAKTKKLIHIDENNIQFIRSFIEKNPAIFSSTCYVGLHRLMRRPSQEVPKRGLIERTIQCYKEHGMKYTNRKIIEYLKGDIR